jgi:hypothetical protein
MGRSTFEGPILSGDNRFPPFRNIGSAELVQSGAMVLTNTTANTANYGGASGQFVTDGQTFANTAVTVYTPSSTSPVLSATSIPADSATQIYRGFVFYLPTGSDINDFFVDVGVVPTVASGSISTITVYVSNNYTVQGGTPTYAATGTISAVGRQALSTFTGTQLANQFSSSTDILTPNGQANVSQLVFTISIAGTSMTTLNAGTMYFTVRYVQPDGNVGSATAYPYGNFD